MLNIHILVVYDITFQEYIVTTSHFIRPWEWFFAIPSYLRLLDPLGMPELTQRYFQFCISPKETSKCLGMFNVRKLFLVQLIYFLQINLIIVHYCCYSITFQH